MIFPPQNILFRYQIKKDERGRECSMYKGEERSIQSTDVEN
jgi:hypothetical protein